MRFSEPTRNSQLTRVKPDGYCGHLCRPARREKGSGSKSSEEQDGSLCRSTLLTAISRGTAYERRSPLPRARNVSLWLLGSAERQRRAWDDYERNIVSIRIRAASKSQPKKTKKHERPKCTHGESYNLTRKRFLLRAPNGHHRPESRRNQRKKLLRKDEGSKKR